MTSATISPFAKRKKAKPQAVSAHRDSLVDTSFLQAGFTTPLILTPKRAGLDGQAWVTENRAYLEEKLQRHGALLFRGFKVRSHDDFRELAAALCPQLYGKYGDLPATQRENIYKVTPYPPDKEILFHNEASHTHRWPMKQFFYCHVPAATGGATPIVDTRVIYKNMDPTWRERFSRLQLRYIRNFIRGVDVSWQDFFKTKDRNEVASFCKTHKIVYSWKGDNLASYQIAPAVVQHPITRESLFFNQIFLHHTANLDQETRKALCSMFAEKDMPRSVTFGDGTPIPFEVVEELLSLYRKHAVSFQWQAGDVLAVDNMLISHSRGTYSPPREMFVAMGQIHNAT